MIIAGLLKTSLIDFPGNISTVIFTGGCNLRCGYCYNHALIEAKAVGDGMSEKELFAFLDKRKTLLDGITVSGGEPCLQKDIVDFFEKLKSTGLKLKIDTNGFFPDKIRTLLKKNLIDYAAVDFKTSPSKYSSLAAVNCDMSKLRDTVDAIRDSGIEYELRTTAVPDFTETEDIRQIGEFTGRIKNWYIQQFVNENTFNPVYENRYSLPVETLQSLSETMSEYADNVAVRGI